MPGKKTSDKDLKHGQTHRILEFVIAINHPIADVKKFPERLTIKARTVKYQGTRKQSISYRELGDISFTQVQDVRGAGAILVRAAVREGETSLWLGYRADPKSNDAILIHGYIPFDFNVVAWRPDSGDRDNRDVARAKGWVDVLSPFNAPGKWQVGHAFAKQANYPIIFLWRCEIPAHFEMHSHVMSNHCAPLPGLWEKTGLTRVIEPGYGMQDLLAGSRFVKGEGGDIGKNSTTDISIAFSKEMAAANFEKVFPFLDAKFTASGCLMPMDMEYMHFDGYHGLPITQSAYGKWWYCWNKKWGKFTNNLPTYVTDGITPPVEIPPDTPTPKSDHGETWCYMSEASGNAYNRWAQQLKEHETCFLTSLNGTKRKVASMPLYHFEPRRHRNSHIFEKDKLPFDWSYNKVVQSNSWTQKNFFFGFKIYTAMGWAPLDPLLKDPLKKFYSSCEKDDIPILNHCTPVGFYSHDRGFYFDLLREKGLVSERVSYDADGWPKDFPLNVPSPDGRFLVGKDKRTRPPESKEEKIWWFIHNYVSPAAWMPVAKAYPKLKFCLAHFGDSAHLDSKGWSDRKVREPATTHKDLTISFSGKTIDRTKSHWFLADLIDLVQPDNRAFIDLSYVMLNERNSLKFQELFDWARVHKPILLERVMWGTDWPLIGNESMVKDYKSVHKAILHRYALAFSKSLPSMPADFFVRVCFLNPIQYLGLHDLDKRLQKAGQADVWPWLTKVPKEIFADFSADKLDLFYRKNKELKNVLE